MSRPRPGRSSLWQRLLDTLLHSAIGPAPSASGPRLDDAPSRPRPDLLQSLGGRVE